MARIAPATVLAALLAAVASGGDLKVSVSAINDGRTGEPSSQVWLDVTGPAVNGKTVKYRVRLSEARDDTGRDLLQVSEPLVKKEMASGKFWESLEADGAPGDAPGISVQAIIGNPAPAAATITIAGDIEVFMPDNDPGAAVRLDDVLGKAGRPLAHAGLASSGVELTVWTKAMAEAARADRTKAAALRGLVTAPDRTMVLGVTDAERRVVDIQFIDEAGQRVDWESAGDLESALRPYQFGRPLPGKVGLRVLVATPKALLKVPFRLVNVPFKASED
jgi:hypothetical protein